MLVPDEVSLQAGLTWLAQRRKAIAAAASTVAPVLIWALDDGTITGVEWVYIAVALVGGGGLTYAVPNKQPGRSQ